MTRDTYVRAALLVVTIVLVVAAIVAVSGSAAAANDTLNETAPYYNNSTTVGNQSAWFAGVENVTLDSLGKMVTRVGPFIIGSGDTIPGGQAYAGTFIMMLLVVGIFVGAITYTSLGMSGGAVVASTVGYGLVSVGLLPSWLRLVLLLIIGVAAGVAVLRATQ